MLKQVADTVFQTPAHRVSGAKDLIATIRSTDGNVSREVLYVGLRSISFQLMKMGNQSQNSRASDVFLVLPFVQLPRFVIGMEFLIDDPPDRGFGMHCD